MTKCRLWTATIKTSRPPIRRATSVACNIQPPLLPPISHAKKDEKSAGSKSDLTWSPSSAVAAAAAAAAAKEGRPWCMHDYSDRRDKEGGEGKAQKSDCAFTWCLLGAKIPLARGLVISVPAVVHKFCLNLPGSCLAVFCKHYIQVQHEALIPLTPPRCLGAQVTALGQNRTMLFKWSSFLPPPSLVLLLVCAQKEAPSYLNRGERERGHGELSRINVSLVRSRCRGILLQCTACHITIFNWAHQQNQRGERHFGKLIYLYIWRGMRHFDQT